MKIEHVLVVALAWTVLALLAWAVVHVGARNDPPEWDEPEDGVQPLDLYLVTLSRDDPRVGMYSRN